jgi:predicted metal-dependent hydrolase
MSDPSADPARVSLAGVTCELRRSARRRTLAIEVHPDLRVIVRAPARASERFIADRVREREPWIRRTLDRLQQAGHEPPPRLAYIDGEIHRHLGEPCRLRVLRAVRAGVRLVGDELQVALRGEPTPARVRRALEAWYREQALALAAELLAGRFAPFAARSHVAPALAVRSMRRRWGSLVARRRMTLNVALVRAPRELFEYVVVHELCHLEHDGHGRGFYRLMDQLMPDWRARRRALARWPAA